MAPLIPNLVDQSILQHLSRPSPDSHKGQNGRLLIIAGSKKYHGALLFAMQTASRIVDMVYAHSSENNLELIKHLRQEMSAFIGVAQYELSETIAICDSILIGPGLEETKENKKLVDNILTKYPEKKIIIDATALWQVNPNLLRHNCVATPHSREFEHTFKADPTPNNVLKMAKYYQCVIVLKGKYDYISDGHELWENRTGNVGMTKGGTGDVLAGLIAGLACKNPLLLSALAGAYLNGMAGDNLYAKNGAFYNAEDLMQEFGYLFFLFQIL